MKYVLAITLLLFIPSNLYAKEMYKTPYLMYYAVCMDKLNIRKKETYYKNLLKYHNICANFAKKNNYNKPCENNKDPFLKRDPYYFINH